MRTRSSSPAARRLYITDFPRTTSADRKRRMNTSVVGRSTTRWVIPMANTPIRSSTHPSNFLICYNADMSARGFVHLHTHSHYSLLEALPRIPDLVEAAKKDGQTALALTDNGNLYGA